MTEALAAARKKPRSSRTIVRRFGTIELIPKWLNLVPMVVQWCWLGLRYRSLTLPSAANPHITAGGLVGDTKVEYFACMGSLARSKVAPFAMLQVDSIEALVHALAVMHKAGLVFPVVAKPNLGWCGFGVRRINDSLALADYLACYPPGESLMLQRYLDEPGEAGIFYARHPDQSVGRLLGVLLRHYPQVTGDGIHTIAQLMSSNARLRRTAGHSRHKGCYDPVAVPAAGDTVRLSLIGSTRVGGRYEDGSDFATTELMATIEAIAHDMPQFHVGRFDVRYRDLHDLRSGRFTIMEVNGAGAEAVHAWDPKYSVSQAYRMVFAKQRLLFAFGAANRARGHRPVGMLTLARHYLNQQRLIRRYPPSN